jgi:polysaccharide biosynthesis transport protein
MSSRRTIACVLGTLLLMSGPAILAAAADQSADANAPSPEQHGATTTVRAWLRVRAVPLRIGADGKLDLAEFDFYKRNLAAIVKSPLVVNKALRDKSVNELPLVKEHSNDADGLAEWLIDQLRIRYPGDAEIMTIEMQSADRHQAATIVNAVVEALKANYIDGERYEHLSPFDNLERKLNSYKQQVLEKERQLYTLSQQIGTVDAQTAKVKYKMEVDALDTLMRSRTDIQRKITDLDLKLALAKSMNDLAERKIPEEEIEAAISRDPEIQKMLAELSQLMREKRELEKVPFKKTDPGYVSIEKQIASLNQSIEEAKSVARQQIVDQLRRAGGGSSSAVQEGLIERQLLDAQHRQITEKIGDQAKTVQELEKFNGDAEQLRAEIDQLKGIVRELGTSLAKQKMELDAEPRVSIIELAH